MKIWFVIGLVLVAVLVYLGLKKTSTKEIASSTPDKTANTSWLSKILSGGASALGIKTSAGAGAGATASGTVSGAGGGFSAVTGLAYAGIAVIWTGIILGIISVFKSKRQSPEEIAEAERKAAEALAYYNAMLPKVQDYLAGKR